VGRFLFFLNLLLALVLGFAIGAGIGWINSQKERPAAAVQTLSVVE
jgi:hypothetical protein